MGECFFWYRLTRVFPDKFHRAVKRLCCVCVPVQITCLTVFLHNLSPSPLWCTSWPGTLHFISSPNHCLLFATFHTIAACFVVVPRLFYLILVSHLRTWNSVFYLDITHSSDHLHLCPLKCHVIFFSYRLGPTSIQYTTSHRTVGNINPVSVMPQ